MVSHYDLLYGCDQIDFKKEVWNIDGKYIETSILTKLNDDRLYIIKDIRTTNKLKDLSFESDLIEDMVRFAIERSNGKDNYKINSSDYSEGTAFSRANLKKNSYPRYKKLISEIKCF